MFPDFMPAETTTFPVDYAMPAFGNAAGKHFLYSTSWPYNTGDKLITYRLFHHHGGAFLTLYTEVPQYLTVSHAPNLIAGATSFNVTANAGSLICLTVNGNILGTATGTGSPVAITIPAQSPSDDMIVTITKQNYYRYTASVPVIANGLYAEFSADDTSPCTGGIVNFTDLSAGSPTSWSWSFPGGTPNSHNGQNPPPIFYNSSGTYDVSLYISDGSDNDSEIKTGYITVTDVVADFSGTPTTVVVGNTVTFTDNSSCSPTSWSWSFPGGTPSSAAGPGPHTIMYNTINTYDVTLLVSNAYGSDSETKTNYIEVIDCNYCATSYSNTSDDYISNVTFNTINNPSGSTTYSDFTSISTDVSTGNTYAISADITVNGSWVQHCWVWIDWNRDCDFDDAGEGFDLGQTPGTSGTHTLSVNIPVPASASLGSTRMRISELYNADPTPCTVSTYGEAEDYTVVIQSTSTPPIADFSADDTTPAVGQTVTFTDNSSNTPTSWSWMINPSTISYVGGTNSSSQNPQVQFNTAGYYTVTLIATNTYGSDPETKNNYILAGTAGNWTGANSSDWNTAGNWENLTLPSGSDNITIPASATNWPTYTGDFTLGTQCLDITLEGSSEMTITGDLTIPAGRTFTCNGMNNIFVDGDLNQDGSFIPGNSTINLNGNTGTAINAGGMATNSLQTTFAGGNGSNGNMFDIVAINEVTIDGFDGNLDAGTGDVYIYYKSGTYVGNETNSAAWTLIGSTSVTSSGAGSPTTIPIPVDVTIPTGQTYAFFVYTDVGNDYTNGSSAGNVYVQDANIQILEGCGKGSPLFTGGTYSPRVFNGIVNYSYGSGSGAVDFYHLTLSKTDAEVVANANLNIQGNLTAGSQSQFTNASGNALSVVGNTMFSSDANGIASYLDRGTTSILGINNYQQYLTSERWHLVSPPVIGSTIGVYNNIYLKEYLEPTDSWNYLVLPLTMSMNLGQGYAAWASDAYTGTITVTYTGSFFNSDLTINSLDYTPGAAKQGFNLIGNPYPCALDWNTSWSLSDLSGWMVVYDNGTYKGIHTDGTPYNGKTDGIIPPSQGFWIRATSSSAGLTIPASQRLHSGQAFYKEVKDNIYPVVRLETEINGMSDEAAVIFHPESTIGYDDFYDLEKFENVQEAPQLFTMTEGGNYGVNFYGEEYDGKIIPVGFKTYESGTYTLFTTEIENFDISTEVYLEDLKTGVITPLLANPEFEFTYEAEDDEHRFNLYFTSTTGLDELRDNSIQISSYQNKVLIKNPALLEGNIVIYNMLGQKIASTNTNRQEFIEIPVSHGLGYYFVNVISDSFIKSDKVLIK